MGDLYVNRRIEPDKSLDDEIKRLNIQKLRRELGDPYKGLSEAQRPRTLYVAAPRTGAVASCLIGGRLRSLVGVELHTTDPKIAIEPHL